MQKLPEASDSNNGHACKKIRDRHDKRKKLILFQQWPVE